MESIMRKIDRYIFRILKERYGYAEGHGDVVKFLMSKSIWARHCKASARTGDDSLSLSLTEEELSQSLKTTTIGSSASDAVFSLDSLRESLNEQPWVYGPEDLKGRAVEKELSQKRACESKPRKCRSPFFPREFHLQPKRSGAI